MHILVCICSNVRQFKHPSLVFMEPCHPYLYWPLFCQHTDVFPSYNTVRRWVSIIQYSKALAGYQGRCYTLQGC